MICTIADTRPTTLHALECRGSPAERHRRQTTQGGQSRLTTGQPYPPRTNLGQQPRTTSLLFTQDNYHTLIINENTPRTDFNPVTQTDHLRPISIAFSAITTMPHAQSDDVKAAHSELTNFCPPYDHSDGNFDGSWATRESPGFLFSVQLHNSATQPILT